MGEQAAGVGTARVGRTFLSEAFDFDFRLRWDLLAGGGGLYQGTPSGVPISRTDCGL